MKTLKLTGFLIACSLFAGCDSGENVSVEYYKSHKDVRIKKLKSCNKESRLTQECQNAAEAQHQVYFGTSN
ncbi:EexN family lipoprotein [Salmonella enterica]|nr:EexN family lipoprotein [Salmonella enterica]EFP6579690.1 EexN family lipoprotein [Salmonella enterica]EGC7970972.1 EexN family lipoprotein [Salmonella enterica]EIV4461155.1 EexN family lipoprotein [Salmonella enterica]